jgi:hypothetical protein
MKKNLLTLVEENEVSYDYFNSGSGWSHRRKYATNINNVLVCWGQGWTGNYFVTYFDDSENKDRYFEFSNYEDAKEFVDCIE